jgi:hypothetical protein
MARVFLSYSSKDREIAQLVSDELKKNFKHTIVVDVDELVVGAAFRDALMRALADSDVVVPLISENSMQAPFVISEIGAARALAQTDRKIGLFPVMVGHLPIPSLVQDFWVLYIEGQDQHGITKACTDLDRAITKHLQQRAVTRTPRLFVSHRHKDEPIAEALVSVLEAAFEISSFDIRCTSVWPYRLRPGDRTPDRLRDEIRHADVVMGILAPDTRESSYVLFELGAAWSQGRLTCPLLVRGATGTDIPDPIKDLHPLSLADGRQCQELLDEIQRATALKRKEGVGGAVEDKIRKLVDAAGTP